MYLSPSSLDTLLFFTITTGIQKREATNCRKIRHFENKFAMETLICEQ